MLYQGTYKWWQSRRNKRECSQSTVCGTTTIIYLLLTHQGVIAQYIITTTLRETALHSIIYYLTHGTCQCYFFSRCTSPEMDAFGRKGKQSSSMKDTISGTCAEQRIHSNRIITQFVAVGSPPRRTPTIRRRARNPSGKFEEWMKNAALHNPLPRLSISSEAKRDLIYSLLLTDHFSRRTAMCTVSWAEFGAEYTADITTNKCIPLRGMPRYSLHADNHGPQGDSRIASRIISWYSSCTTFAKLQ